MLHHKREIEASLVPRADISWRSFAVTLLWYHAAIAQTQPRARSQLLTDHAHPSTQQRQAGHADIMRCLIPSISTDGRAFAMVSRTLQRSHLRFSPPWRHGGGVLISNLRCIVHTPTPSLLRLPPAAADHRRSTRPGLCHCLCHLLPTATCAARSAGVWGVATTCVLYGVC